MFSAADVCVAQAINNGSTPESRTGVKAALRSALNSILKHHLTTLPAPGLKKELLPLQHSLAGTYHAAAGHTPVLSPRCPELSRPGGSPGTAACAPLPPPPRPPPACRGGTANQKQQHKKVWGAEGEQAGRGAIHPASRTQLGGHRKGEGLREVTVLGTRGTCQFDYPTGRAAEPPVARVSPCALMAFSG